MSDFDWTLIRSFLAVAETGSLSAAARLLRSSQPTIGRHVAELERDLGVTLFRRGLGGYELTDAGGSLLGHATTVREAVDRFSLQASGREERIAGTVRISASEVVATLILPTYLARFMDEEPGIEIELVGSNQVDNLLRRDADIAVRMVNPSQEELVARKVADIPMGFCAHKNYADRYGLPETPFDLLNHRLIGQDRADDFVRGFREFGAEIDRHAFHFRSDDQVILWQAVLSGVGIGIAQMPLIQRHLELVTFLPDVPLPVLPVWITCHKDVRHNPRFRRVADFLHAALSDFARSADAV